MVKASGHISVAVCNLQIFNFNYVFNVYTFNYFYWVVICMEFYSSFCYLMVGPLLCSIGMTFLPTIFCFIIVSHLPYF